MKSSDPLVQVAQALHPQRRGWVVAIGDRDGFRRPLWIDWRKPNALQLLRRYAIDQGGARMSRSSFCTPGSRKAENVLSCLWIQLDDDGDSCWRFASVQPSLVVVSSTAGHHHVLWRVEDLDIADVGRLDQGQAELLNGDRGFTGGATSTVRLPLEEGDLVRLTDRSYRALDLRQHHRPTTARKSAPPIAVDPPADRAAAVGIAVDGALAAVAGGASRNVEGIALAFDLRRLRLSEAEAMKAMERYQEPVEVDPDDSDDPYTIEEAEAQIETAFAGGAIIEDAEVVAEAERIERAAQGDGELSGSQKAIVSHLCDRAKRTGSLRVPASLRGLADAGEMRRETVVNCLRGSKRVKPLLGSYLKRDRRWKRGKHGEFAYELIQPSQISPSTPSTTSLHIPSSTVNWSGVVPPLSSTVPPNHPAFRHGCIGHNPRVLLDFLVSLDQPVKPSELAKVPGLSNVSKTIRRQLHRLTQYDLARRLPDGRWEADADNLIAKLDAAAAETGADQRAERQQQRHHQERIAFALAPSKRKAREADQLRRVCQRRKRRDRPRVRQRRHPLPDPRELQQRREDRTLVRRHVHRPRVIRSGIAARPRHILKPPPADSLAVL